MCLAVPAQVESVRDEAGTMMGRVTFGGVVRDVCLGCVPGIGVGDWCLVHAGLAIARLDEAEAQRTLAAYAALGVLDDEADDAADAPGVAP